MYVHIKKKMEYCDGIKKYEVNNKLKQLYEENKKYYNLIINNSKNKSKNVKSKSVTDYIETSAYFPLKLFKNKNKDGIDNDDECNDSENGKEIYKEGHLVIYYNVKYFIYYLF